MNYLDANFATALHFSIRGQTELAERFVRKNSMAIIFSELAALECRRAFIMRNGKPNSENWIRLQALVASGAWQRDLIHWRALSEKAEALIDRFGVKLRAGTLDTLHIAQAMLSGCTRFLSFDTNSSARVLAVSCGLQVFPELSVMEKGRVVC